MSNEGVRATRNHLRGIEKNQTRYTYQQDVVYATSTPSPQSSGCPAGFTFAAVVVGGDIEEVVVGADVVDVNFLEISTVFVVLRLRNPVVLLAAGRAVDVVSGGAVLKQIGVQQSPQAAHTSQFSGSSRSDPADIVVGQALHAVLPAGQAYLPGAHWTQVEALAVAAKVPRGQGMQGPHLLK